MYMQHYSDCAYVCLYVDHDNVKTYGLQVFSVDNSRQLQFNANETFPDKVGSFRDQL